MPEKKKRICKVCPKKKKPHKPIEELEVTEEEIYELPTEEEEKQEEDIFPCLGEVESCKEIATAKYVLDEILPPKKQRPSFFCTTAPKSRYENLLPVNVVNDHQREASIQKTVIDHLGALRVTSEPFCKRQSAIIATIGPSCWKVEEIEELLHAGMNIARINMAYGDRCCQYNAIQNFKEAVKIFHGKIGMKVPVGLMMDLKGPEIRTGRICRLYACNPENPVIFIEKNSVVKLTTEITYIDKCMPSIIYIDYSQLPKLVRPGMKIYIDDGAIELFVQEVKETEIITSVKTEGHLRNYRPVYVPMVSLPVPTITNIDAEDIELAIEEDFDFIALSKIKCAKVIQVLKGKLIETLLTRKRLREKQIMILAKISNFQALSNIDDIIHYADGIIIQRGDLGLELPPEKIFVAQREIIGKCNLANKPVICSTQLMKSMTRRLLAIPSHIFDVAGCIEDGADGICLTEETAVGFFPADTVEQSHHILREAEAADAKKYHFQEISDKLEQPVEPIVAIGRAACLVAEKIKATCIIVLTTSGKAARIISWFRPRCVVLAVTSFQRTAKQLHLWRTVCPVYYSGPCIKDNWFDSLDLRFQFGIAFGMQVGFIKEGDPLILVSGYGRNTSFTNFLRIVYASTEPSVFLQHPKEFYNNIYMQRDCPRTQTKEPCIRFENKYNFGKFSC